MIPTSADILGIDTPKDLSSYRETIMPSIVTTSRGTIDCAWIRTRRNVSHLGSHCLNGPRWGMRLGSCDDAILFRLWAQWGWGFFSLFISPPLIRAQFSGVNQGTQETKGLAENSNGQNRAIEVSINALSKGVLLLAIRSAVISLWRFVNRSGMHVALNEGLLGIPPLRCGVLRTFPYKYSLLSLFLTFASFVLQIFTLSSIHL